MDHPCGRLFWNCLTTTTIDRNRFDRVSPAQKRS